MIYFIWSHDLFTPPPQISELSDLADRPLVGALTSRLQALHTQLQAFVERVDGLGNPQTGARDPQVEGAFPVTLTCTSLPFSGDDQDRLNTAEDKVKDKKHAPLLPPLVTSFSFIYYQLIFLSFNFVDFIFSVMSLFFYSSVFCFFQCWTIILAA